MTSLIIRDLSVVKDVDFRELMNRKVPRGKQVGPHLDVVRGSKFQVRILDSISLELNSGDRLAVVGANGAGKTSFLRVCAGLMHHSEGIIERSTNPTSMIDINAGLDPEATGFENIKLRAALLGYSKQTTLDLISHVEDHSELGKFIDLPVRVYSTGMMMRLCFAIASFGQAEILILDEWLSVGDNDYQKKSQERLLAKVEDSHILIFASHSRDMLERLCNKALWLEGGKVKEFGEVQPILEKYFAA